ncbi:MAG: DNA translocase FtsK 4TM domain-containing protein [Patescibacteria group bacterium]
MGRKRLHPKKKPNQKWYQKEDDWGNFVFDWSLGLSPQAWRLIFATVILLFSVTIILGFFDKSGVLGLFFSKLIIKLFGSFGAYIFGAVLLYLGIILIKPRKNKDGKGSYRIAEFLGLFLLAFSVPTFIHLFVPPEISGEVGGRGQYGGLVGHGLSVPLRNAIGLFPTFLFTVAMAGVSILMIFEFSLTDFLGWGDKKEKEDGESGRVNVNRTEPRVSVFESVRKRLGLGKASKEAESKATVIEVAQSAHPPVHQKEGTVWHYPTVELLNNLNETADPGNIYKNAEAIQKCLNTFNIDVELGDANVGPTVTQYTLKPTAGVKLNQIVARQNDLALALSAKSIRIEAPIPGKNAVGIEIPNKKAAKVTLREILFSPEFKTIKSKLTLALGRDVAGDSVSIDLEKMPHLLIAGSTGSGKSVCINAIISSLLYNNSPAELRLLLVDPKRVELTCYNAIPHLITPVVTEVDKTVSALKWAVWEMERRYKMFSELGKRNIIAYNVAPGPEGKLPYMVIIIDELADLMATSSKEVEGSIVRLAQMARATGMHLIIATQRPSVDVLTGLIKANIASRIAFATASQVDSRTILDISGAEKLLGNGDMLFMAAGIKPRRIQGCFISDPEIEKVTDFLKKEGGPQYDESILSFGASRGGGVGNGMGTDEDDLYNDAVETVVNAGKGSASLLQRRLKVGYARAARLLDILEENGVIGPQDGAKPRDVLVSSSEIGGYKSVNDEYNNSFSGELSKDDEGEKYY